MKKLQSGGKRSKEESQQGFTLVELMVALAIGIVIVLFVSSLYASSLGSSRLIDDNARMHEDGRAVMHLLGRNLMQSGYGNVVALNPYSPTDFTGPGLLGCDTGFSNPGKFEAGIAATCGESKTAAFEVSYRVEDDVNAATGAGTDCNGQAAPSVGGTRVAVNRFYLAKKTGATALVLYCAGNGNPIPQPLLENVEAMHLTYGVDTDDDGSADKFMTSASAVEKAANWKSVVSVNVCLQLISANNVAQSTQHHTDCTGEQRVPKDHRLSVVFSSTFNRRNSKS